MRLAVGLTQSQAAEKLGVSRRTWQDWERGVYPMPKSRRDHWKLLKIDKEATDGRNTRNA